MDVKRRHRAENVAKHTIGNRPALGDTHLRADKPAAARRPPKLGELLVAQGHISREQLAAALASQQTNGRRLGEELIKAGYVKRSVVSLALRKQRRMTFTAMCSALAVSMLAVSTIAPDVEAAAQREQIAVSAAAPAQTVSRLLQ